MLAISIGDINGIGLEIALKAHKHISAFCSPRYCVHKNVLKSGAKLLHLDVPKDFICVEDFADLKSEIAPGKISADAGRYSYESFMCGINLVKSNECEALLTLPIHKKAWHKAGISDIGHTQTLSRHFKREAIMMLGCEKMFVALFTEHVALSNVSAHIDFTRLCDFLLSFAMSVRLESQCCVLGLNPHCGDGGIIGKEDDIITESIMAVNARLKKDLFLGAYPPDSAFSPANRARFKYFVSMYHDVGLAPLKALYFEESINVSLNLPILRTSVDHGVAFDKAYKRANDISLQSYINAAQYAVDNAKRMPKAFVKETVEKAIS